MIGEAMVKRSIDEAQSEVNMNEEVGAAKSTTETSLMVSITSITFPTASHVKI
jgi:hypothetical protein